MKASQEARSFWTRDNGDTDCLPFQAQGGCADLIRAIDWNQTPLGPMDRWDAGLVSTLNLMLGTRFPMFLAWGPEHLLFYNDAYEPVLSGKKRSMGRPFHLVFPEAWTRTGPLLRHALAGESVYLEDFPVPLERDGEIADSWWSFCYSPVYAQQGDIRGVLGVVHETTRRVLTEQALWASEAALRSVTDKAPALMWRCDPEGRFDWVNQRLEDYGAVSAAGGGWADLVHPDEREEGRAIHDACVSAGRPYEAQQRVRRRDGSYRWHLVRAQQMFDEAGQLVGWCGSAVDIDDWRAAAEQVTERDARFHEISASATSLIWSADAATRRVEGLNPRFRAPWALPSDGTPIVWEDWVATLHPDDRSNMLAVFDRVVSGETIQGEFRANAPDGTPRWFHATAFPIPDHNGVVRRIGGLLVEVRRSSEVRVYLVGAEHDDALAASLAGDDCRIRRFEGLSALRSVVDDLLPGVIVIGRSASLDEVLEAAPALKANAQRLPWIVVGPLEDRLSEVVQLMKHGAANVISDTAPVEAVCSAVRAAQPTQAPTVARTPASKARDRLAQLSLRERQVLEGLAAGGTNKTIAIQLSLSPRTVETYRAQLMDRLGVRTLADLLRLAADAAAAER